MLHSALKIFAWALLAVLIVACSKPDTPQEVAAAFWQALADNDAEDAVDYSTLTDAKEFDRFEGEWADVVPSFGRMVMDNTEATIVTRLPPETGDNGERIEAITYLVNRNEQWLVDYARTREAVVNPSPFSNLMGQISRLSNRITASFSSSSNDMEQRLNEMARELEAYSEEMSRRADEAVTDFGRVLQDAMEELEESVNRALKENRQAPESDRESLEQAAKDLEDSGEELAEPTLEAVVEASRTLAQTSQRLAELSSESFTSNRDEWAAKMKEIRLRSEQFFRELQESLGSEQ